MFFLFFLSGHTACSAFGTHADRQTVSESQAAVIRRYPNTRASAAERQKCNKSVLPQQHLASVSPHIIVIRYTACFIHIQKVFFPQRDPKIRTKIISNILLITRELWCVPDPRGLAGSSVKSLFFLCIFLSNPSVPRVLY